MTKLITIPEFHWRITQKNGNLRIPCENHKNYANTRISLRIKKINKVNEFQKKMLKIIITMEFHARIQKIMKLV